jgi:uncharacterized membrane protein YeaQ/YmgE (transglycosylase-associated protein family)
MISRFGRTILAPFLAQAAYALMLQSNSAPHSRLALDAYAVAVASVILSPPQRTKNLSSAIPSGRSRTEHSFAGARSALVWLAWMAVIGLAVGWLVAFISKDRGRGGLATDLFVGIAGSLAGGLISEFVGLGRHSLLGRALISLIAAFIFLVLLQMIKRS